MRWKDKLPEPTITATDVTFYFSSGHQRIQSEEKGLDLKRSRLNEERIIRRPADDFEAICREAATFCAWKPEYSEWPARPFPPLVEGHRWSPLWFVQTDVKTRGPAMTCVGASPNGYLILDQVIWGRRYAFRRSAGGILADTCAEPGIPPSTRQNARQKRHAERHDRSHAKDDNKPGV